MAVRACRLSSACGQQIMHAVSCQFPRHLVIISFLPGRHSGESSLFPSSSNRHSTWLLLSTSLLFIWLRNSLYTAQLAPEQVKRHDHLLYKALYGWVVGSGSLPPSFPLSVSSCTHILPYLYTHTAEEKKRHTPPLPLHTHTSLYLPLHTTSTHMPLMPYIHTYLCLPSPSPCHTCTPAHTLPSGCWLCVCSSIGNLAPDSRSRHHCTRDAPGK